MSESSLLFHGPCKSCGSTDANAAYSDGHSHCFSCGVTADTEGEVPDKGSPNSAPVRFHEVTTKVPLKKRALDAATLTKWGYGLTKISGDRLIHVAQCFDANGQLVAQKLRYPDKSFVWKGDRKATTPLYGMWLWSGRGRRVTITEGELDALSVSQAQGNKWPVVSLPDGAVSAVKAVKAASEWLSGYETVVLMFDMDEVGQKAAREVTKILRPGQAVIAKLPLKDASDMLQAGRGDELIRATWNATPYRPDGLVTGKEALEHLRRPVPPAVPYPFPKLQEVTGGLRTREVTLIMAGAGVGKSTFAREVALSVAETQGVKIGYVALEESVQRTMLDLTGMKVGRNLREPVYSRGDLSALDGEAETAAAAWVAERFQFYDHFGSLDGPRLQEVMRHMAVVEGCKFIILDHVSIVVSGGGDPDERKAIDRIMTTTRQMVEETGVGMVVVSHVKRRTGEGKAFEEGAVPRLSDGRGSGALEQIPDTSLALARNMTSEDGDGQDADIYVLKNRAMGRLGRAGTIHYDIETGRMEAVNRPTEVVSDFTPAGESEY